MRHLRREADGRADLNGAMSRTSPAVPAAWPGPRSAKTPRAISAADAWGS